MQLIYEPGSSRKTGYLDSVAAPTTLKYNIYYNILTKYVIPVSTHNSVTSHDNKVFKERLTIVQFVVPGAENPDNGCARDHYDSTFS